VWQTVTSTAAGRTWSLDEPAVAIEWIGGQPIGETLVRRVNRTTARTLIECELADLPGSVARDVEVWVENQMYAMPIHVKIGVAAVAFVATVHAILRMGRPQWRLGPAMRRHLLHCWATSPIPPLAQYVRLERSLMLYAAYEHPNGLRSRPA
jgi:hypothetical protein